MADDVFDLLESLAVAGCSFQLLLFHQFMQGSCDVRQLWCEGVHICDDTRCLAKLTEACWVW